MNFLKKLFSPTILIISLLLLFYTFYRSEITYSGDKRHYYLIYYIISLLLILFSIMTFFISYKIKEYIIITSLSLFVSLYLFEGYLTLDLNNNTFLYDLSCGGTNLTTLDLSNNTNLYMLNCQNGSLSSIDVSQCHNLFQFYCWNNQFTNLDVSGCINLHNFECSDNDLYFLNMQNNHNVYNFHCENNPNLTCIEVDNTLWSTTNWTDIDPIASFSTNCPNSCIVDIEENTLPHLSIYPNPTNGLFTVDLGKLENMLK